MIANGRESPARDCAAGVFFATPHVHQHTLENDFKSGEEFMGQSRRKVTSKIESEVVQKTDPLPAEKLTGRVSCKLVGGQASIFLALISLPLALMATFTASSIGSLKGTSIRSRPCS